MASEEQAWKILERTSVRLTGGLPGISIATRYRYRLLDLLVGQLLSLLLPEYGWNLTPASQAGGVDLEGLHVLFRIPELDVEGQDLIIGRALHVPRRVGRRQLSRDLLEPLGGGQRSHVILAVPAPVSAGVYEDVRREYERSSRKTFVLLGVSELEYLFGHHLGHLERLIRSSLSQEEAEIVTRHFSAISAVPRLRPASEVYVPPKGETGKPFYVQFTLRPSLLSAGPFRLRWIWPIGRDHSPAIQLISSPEAIRPTGLLLNVSRRLQLSASLKLRSFQAGRQSLGKFLIYSGDNSVVEEVELGEIDIIEQYHPAFYRPPFLVDLNGMDDLLQQTEAGHLHIAIVTGSGGSGKTRLCEEFGFLAEQRGFNWISRSHPNHQDQPYKIFGDLLRSLVPEPPSQDKPLDVVASYLAGLNPALATAASQVLKALFSYTGIRSDTETFHREVFLRILLTLLIDQSERQPTCIHLSDLHWCAPASLQLLTEAIDRLRELDSSPATRLIFVLEGRVGELLRENSTADYDHATAAGWETFIERMRAANFFVRPLDSQHSRSFLEHLFESTQSRERRVPRDLIPHQEDLLGAILRYGEGNPFHMIEQIKLLRNLRIIEQNPRTGLLFLSERTSNLPDMPGSVRDLIRKRFLYFLQTRRPVAVLVRSVAVLGDRIDGALFERLRACLAPQASPELIASAEFLVLHRDFAGEVRFRHENYYEALRQIDLYERDAVLSVYTSWLEEREPSAEVFFQRGCIAAQTATPNAQEVRDLFAQSYRLYDSQLKHQMSVRALEHLLRLLPTSVAGLMEVEPRRFWEFVEYRTALSKRITWTGDWKHARALQLELVEILQRISENRSLLGGGVDWLKFEYVLHSAQVELANIEMPILYYAEAIERLERTLVEVRIIARTATGEDSADSAWSKLLVRCINRLGVTLWFEGHLARACRYLRESLRLARIMGDDHLASLQLRDLGTARIHINPWGGHRLLADSLQLLGRVNHMPRQKYMATYQDCVARLIGTQRETPHLLAGLAEENLPQIEEIYVHSRRETYITEEAASALVVAICLAVLERPQASLWFQRSISAAFRGGLSEFLWKGYLNLAQHYLLSTEHTHEGAAVYAQQAQKILEADLSRRSPDNRSTRLRLYELPLLHLARIWLELKDPRGPELLARYPFIRERLSSDSHWRVAVPRREHWTPLLVSHGDNDYFFMN